MSKQDHYFAMAAFTGVAFLAIAAVSLTVILVRSAIRLARPRR